MRCAGIQFHGLCFLYPLVPCYRLHNVTLDDVDAAHCRLCVAPATKLMTFNGRGSISGAALCQRTGELSFEREPIPGHARRVLSFTLFTREGLCRAPCSVKLFPNSVAIFDLFGMFVGLSNSAVLTE